MRQLIPFCILLYLLVSCTAKKQNDKIEFVDVAASELSGKELSMAHCSRCHAFVSPELLPKTSWKDVLPAMGHRMGIYSGGFRPDSLFDAGLSGSIVRDANIFPEKPVLAKADWAKIEKYYLENAPDTVLPPLRKSKIRIGLPAF
jgi:hypothetical protein